MANLKQIYDEDIDFSDIPEVKDWTGAIRGKFYRPPTENITLDLDTDILSWFKKHFPKYNIAINNALREYINSQHQKSV